MGNQGTLSGSVRALSGDIPSLCRLASLHHEVALNQLAEALYPTVQSLDGGSTLALVLRVEAELGGATAVANPEELLVAVATRIAPHISSDDPEGVVCDSLAWAAKRASRGLRLPRACELRVAQEFGDEPDLAVRHMGRARHLAALLIALWRM